MDASIISALAALGGSTVGATASIISTGLLQRGQREREAVARDLTHREALYCEFINEGSRVFAHAVTTDMEDTEEIIRLYALVGRIRLVASDPVVEAAEVFLRLVIRFFGEPNRTLNQLRASALDPQNPEPLNDFSQACRADLQLIQRRSKLFLRAQRGA